MINQAFQHKINQELNRFFEQKRKSVENHDQRLVELVNQIADLTSRGGKRLRPYLASLGFLGCKGGSNWQSILPVLLALELNHTYFLIHDDIMDQAQIRRQKLAIHAHFTQILRNKHLALSLAILAGDLCNQWTQELFDQLSQNDNTIKARKIFNQMREEVIIGQTMDVWGMRDKDTKDLLNMYYLKTGSYSVEKPLLIGAILSGANSIQLKALSSYGQKLGLAYQLKDDLLDIFGPRTTGKPVGKDIVEGKWTILIAKTWNKLALPDRKTLIKTLGNKKSTTVQIDWVKQEMVETQAKLKVEKLVQNLIEQAKQVLKQVKLHTKEELIRLAEFIGNRNL